MRRLVISDKLRCVDFERRVKLLRRVLCGLMALASLCVPAATQTQQKEVGQNPATFDERLGTDDGAALAILFGANMRGNLSTCDCSFPRGGLARRVGYVEAFKKRFKDTPVVQVEAGFFFYGDAGSALVDLQNEQVALAYSRWPIDVINLGRDDLIYARKMLVREGLNERIQTLPMIRNLISANGVFAKEAAPPAAYSIKEVGGPRIHGGNRKLKIGFVGVAEPHRPGGGMYDITVTNMFQAATAAVIKARRECDVLVIVAHCEWKSALQLAAENLESDIVIAGNAEGFYKPQQVGNTLVVSAAPGNIQEGDLRFYLDKEGRVTFKFRSTDLDSVVPSDPAAAAFVEAAGAERQRVR
jgi:2',3'-cyclic-nucleotide 2'-phosphodiesterase (5'-nucleotidase family)